MSAALLCLLLAAGAPPESLPQAVVDLTAQIGKEPNNPTLYLRRAQKLRERGDLEAALGDLEYAAALPGAPRDVALLTADVLHQMGREAAALVALDRVLAADPRNVAATVLRARALVALGRRAEGIAAYRGALEAGIVREPEHYAEVAALLAAGNKTERLQALRVLDEGIAHLGPIVSLEEPAITLEVGLGRWDAAVARTDAVAATVPRKDLWLKRRGDLLRQARRLREAREAYAAALRAVEALPEEARRAPATKTLARELRGLAAGRPGSRTSDE
jgi:tetratricopeptide (TPR) repeat protein